MSGWFSGVTRSHTHSIGEATTNATVHAGPVATNNCAAVGCDSESLAAAGVAQLAVVTAVPTVTGAVS